MQDLFHDFFLESGLVKILNEECVRPNATADSFVRKFKRINQHMDCLVQNKLATPEEFGIKHYAGDVTYDASNFIVRNKDALADDLVTTACKCNNPLISIMATRMVTGGQGKKSVIGQQRGWMVADTVLNKFQTQLKELFESLELTKTRYIRCIKPNTQCLPYMTDHLLMLNQMRSAGLVTALCSARMFFPNKMLHRTFIQRFGCVVKSKGYSIPNEINDMVELLLEGSNLKPKKTDDIFYAVGTTRIYFRSESLSYLEAERRHLLIEKIIKIQAFSRMTMKKSHYYKIKYNSTHIQSRVRMYQQKQTFIRTRYSILKMQCAVRSYSARLKMKNLRMNSAASKIQTR